MGESVVGVDARAVVLRRGRVLVRPDGLLPSVGEASEFITFIDERAHGAYVFCGSSLGEAPAGWRWLRPGEAQAGLDDEGCDALGEVMLCV